MMWDVALKLVCGNQICQQENIAYSSYGFIPDNTGLRIWQISGSSVKLFI